MYSKSLTAAIAATLIASANAHFFISSPAPIPGTAPKDPLDPSGANFPCHGADLSGGSATSMQAGSSQTLSFELGGGANTAVHGGGSCQLALTYETDAAKLKDPASWKVIQSFVGGCPTNAKGNLDGSGGAVKCAAGGSSANCVPDFSFKIPQEVQNGNAILAWTWFNNVGNREMYMNCAKVSLSGGSGSMGSLPSLFVANLASINQCKTTERINTDFPNPGAYVQKDATMNYPLGPPTGSGCGGGSGSGSVPATGGSGSTGSGSGSTGSGSTGSGSTGSGSAGSGGSGTTSANNGQYTGVGAGSGGSGAAQPSVNSPPAASTPAVVAPTSTGRRGGRPTGRPGVFAPGASDGTAPVATTLVTSAAPAANTGAPSPAAPAQGSPAAGSGSCGAGQVTCTASGFYCIDQTTFGMCSFGCATPQAVAAGTDCSNGAVVHAVTHPKRRLPRRHAHKRHFGDSF